MNFVVENSGKLNIIFLHGWGADHKSFLWLKDYIKHHTLHFADLDGFGTAAEPNDITIAGYCQRLRKYVKENGLQNVVLVGHSFGGRVAIEYASKYSIEKLVLVDAAGIKPKASLKKWWRIKKFKIAKWLSEKKIIKLAENKYGSADYKTASHQMKLVLKECLTYDQTNLLKNINCPTMIVWGEKDKDTPMYMAKTMEKNIKQSKLVVLKNCGHFSFLEKPYEFYKYIDLFIENKGDKYE